MKNLQNNFTTSEQSRRLLALGVPADSADMGRVEDIMHGGVEVLRVPYQRWCKGYENVSTPCWSVGRLIEIFRICGDIECLTWLNARFSEWNIEDLVQAFELYAQEDDILPETVLNFSKLED